MESNTVDVTVIGAGVIGMATAYAAARRGLSVRLIDRASAPAAGASFANGAQLSYAYTDSMASPALWRKLPSIALGMDRALSMRWSTDLDFLRWGQAFLRQCTPARFQANTLAVLEMAVESRAAMQALLAAHRVEFKHTAPGKMHLYHDRAALQAASVMVAIKQAHGVDQHVLDASQAAALEPALANVAGIVGVVHSPGEEVGDPRQFCEALLGLLQAHYAMDAHFGCEVTGVERAPRHMLVKTADGRRFPSRRVVVCNGVDAASLARPLGIRLPLMSVKGYSVTASPGASAPAISITDTARKLVFCRLGDKIRIAGLAEVGNHDPAADPRRVRELVTMARQSLPLAADYDSIDSDWAGLRPMTPSSVPIIRRVQPDVVVNVGHGMLGWTLAMGAGERALDALLDAS